MLEGETLAGIIADYEKVTQRTDELVRTLPDLDASTSCRRRRGSSPAPAGRRGRAFTHIVAETAQHAGHADILRETIDGQKSMG